MAKIFLKILLLYAFFGVTACGSKENDSSAPAPKRDPNSLTPGKGKGQSGAQSADNQGQDVPDVPDDPDNTDVPTATPDQAQPDDDPEPSTDTDTDPIRDPARPGPYQAASYTQGLEDAGYSSAIVYYPENNEQGLLPATTLVAGYTNTKEQIVWMAEHLATHGFVVIAFTPVSNFSLNAADWSAGHQAAFQKLKTENQRNGSPVFGRIDTARLGLMGFSMGGAGTILAGNTLPDVRAAVAFCAYQPVTPNGNNPLMLVTGTADTVAQPQAIENAYSQITGSKSRALLSFRNLAHGDILRSASFRDPLAKYFTGFLLSNLAGRSSYQSIFTASQDQAERDRLFANFDFKP